MKNNLTICKVSTFFYRKFMTHLVVFQCFSWRIIAPFRLKNLTMRGSAWSSIVHIKATMFLLYANMLTNFCNTINSGPWVLVGATFLPIRRLSLPYDTQLSLIYRMINNSKKRSSFTCNFKSSTDAIWVGGKKKRWKQHESTILWTLGSFRSILLRSSKSYSYTWC